MTEQPRYRIAVLGGTGAQGSGLALRLANAATVVNRALTITMALAPFLRNQPRLRA